MRRTVQPVHRLDARLTAPGDKSIAHRALILAGVARGRSRLIGVPPGDDVGATRDAMRALGAHIVETPGEVQIDGSGFEGLSAPSGPLDARNSGTTMRLLAGLLAGRPFDVKIVGDPSLSRRPMDRVAVPLRAMGAEVETLGADGRPPVRVRGRPLRGLTYRLPVASAQVKSALLLAGLQAVGPTRLIEPLATRDHTERMLRAMGARIGQAAGTVDLEPGTRLQPLDLQIPGDFSAAAPWLCAAALRPGWRVVVEGVGVNPTRTGFLDVLERAGSRVTHEQEREEGGESRATITVEGGRLQPIELAPEEVPRLIDELPLVAVLATQAPGVSRVAGAGELRVKESDRIRGMGAILRALGGRFTETAEGFLVEGPTSLHGARVDPRGDHRLAMAATVAALVAAGETLIEGADVVTVSYPGFWRDLERMADA